MASDSRLRFGCAWDCGPKVLTFPRTDCAIVFAGDTFYAYPLMLHMSAVIGHYSRARTRAMDIFDLKGHIVRVFNNLQGLISDLPYGQRSPEPPETNFIFAGYSWRRKRFVIWKLHFDLSIMKFTFRPSLPWRGGRRREKVIAIIGDYMSEAKNRLIAKLKTKGKLVTGGFDMEPFEVLRDMIRSDEYQKIGGAPQMVKIYEHMNCAPYAIYWPDRDSKRVTLLGRPLLDYEIAQRPVLDPDTLSMHEQEPWTKKHDL